MKVNGKKKISTSVPQWMDSVLAAGVLLLCAYLLWHYLTQKTYLAGHITGLFACTKDILILLLFVGCSSTLGARLLRLLVPGLGQNLSGHRLVFSFGIGFTFYSLLGLLISMAHVLSPTVLWSSLLIPAVLCRREWHDVVSLVRTKLSEPVRMHPIGFLFAILFFIYGIVALSPPWAIDELTYHVTVPLEYLRNGGIPATTTTAFNYQPVAMSMLYLYLMGIGSDYLPKLLNYFFLILMVSTFYLYAVSLTTKKIASLAALLFASQWVVQHGVPRANIDFHFAFYALTSFFLIVDIFLPDRPGVPSMSTENRILLSGIFLGTAIFSKYTAISAVVGSEFLLLYLLAIKRIGFRHFVMFNLFAAAVFVPCMFRNYLYTGDPLFWFLSKVMKCYRIVNADQLEAMPGIVNLGVPNLSFQLFFLGPFFTYFYGAFPTINFDGFIDPFYMVTMGVGFILFRNAVPMRVMFIYVFAYYGVWIMTAPTTRYLLPILPLLALITTITLHGLADSVNARIQVGMRRSMIAILLVFCLINMASFWVSSGYFVGKNVQAYLGMIDRDEYLSKTEAGATLEVKEFINKLEKEEGKDEEPGSRKIFMIHANQSYYLLDRGTYSDVLHLNLPLLKSFEDQGQDPVAWLRAEGYRYVLYDVGRIYWYLRPTSKSPYLNPHPENVKDLESWGKYFSTRLEPRLKNLGRFRGLILFSVPDK